MCVQGVADSNNALSAMAILALVKLLSSKRFDKAIKNNQPIPENLLNGLADTMKTSQELGLHIPPRAAGSGAKFHWEGQEWQEEIDVVM